MALIHVEFFSRTLGMCTSCNVVLPQQRSADEPGRVYPVLTLLHGFGDSPTSWVRRTDVEALAEEHGFAVVMPEAQLSSYADMLHGLKFFTYIADELPGIMRSFFPLSARREDNFIGGCSMGGYGALKIGLNRPEQYGAIGSLSSGHISYRGFISQTNDRCISLQYLTFGDTGLDAEDRDTAERACALAESGENVPRIFITCGFDDQILLNNAREACDFFSSFEGNPFDFEYSEHPGGHTWAFWDAHICDFLRFAGLNPHSGTI
jgi:S-formylglutathione hydrolase FrmB